MFKPPALYFAASEGLGSRPAKGKPSREGLHGQCTRSRIRGRSLCVALVATLSGLALALPSAGRAFVNIEGHTPVPLPDYDSRASVAPSADQLAAANALGADVSWNRFGVASSVSKGGAYVAKGLQAPDAVSAARQWLDANKALFRLDSTDSLAVATTQPFVGTTNDYAIVFRQVADGVASTDGVATVRSSVRRPTAGTSSTRRRASPEAAPTRPAPTSSIPPLRGPRPRTTPGSTSPSSTSLHRARRPERRRSPSTASRRRSTSRRPSSRRRTTVPAPRTTRPSRRAATATWRATRSSSTHRPAISSTARARSTTPPTTRPGWPRGTRCRTTT